MDKHLLDELISVHLQIKQAFAKQSHLSREDVATTMLQCSALGFLLTSKHATVGDVAGHLQLSLSSATQLVERLTKSELVKRKHDPSDRRIIRLSITENGIKELENMQEKMRNKLEKIFSKIPEQDVREYIRIQKSVLTALQEQATEEK
jgi:DNA-binding MarR family transcriptional regulator